MDGGPIRTVAPSTTADGADLDHHRADPRRARRGRLPGGGRRRRAQRAALVGLGPATPAAASRPRSSSRCRAFRGQRPPVVTRAEFRDQRVHRGPPRRRALPRLPRDRRRWWSRPRRLLRAGEPFVYAYYDGIDKVAHEYGLAEHYDAELAYVDRLVGDLVAVAAARRGAGGHLPTTARSRWATTWWRSTATCSTSCRFQSGEGRFRWLHARPGRADGPARGGRGRTTATRPGCVSRRPADRRGLVRARTVTDAARGRLGDVALVATGDLAFFDPRRHRPVRADQPPRLAHRGRDAGAAAGRATAEARVAAAGRWRAGCSP